MRGKLQAFNLLAAFSLMSSAPASSGGSAFQNPEPVPPPPLPKVYSNGVARSKPGQRLAASKPRWAGKRR